MDDQGLNILVEWEVLNLNRVDDVAATGRVDFLMSGLHLLAEKINLLTGEWLKDVLKKVHLIAERFRLEVSLDDVREIVADLPVFLRPNAFTLLMLVFLQAGEILAFPEAWSPYLTNRQRMKLVGFRLLSPGSGSFSQAHTQRNGNLAGDRWIFAACVSISS